VTGRILANRILESADDDFDPLGEIDRLAKTRYPDIELEQEGQHWNVYRKVPGTPAPAGKPNEITFGTQSYQTFIGEIYTTDAADAPSEEARKNWQDYPWVAVAGFRDSESKACKSFDEALEFILAIHVAKTGRPVRESEDLDDPSAFLEDYEPSIEVTNEAPGTAYDKRKFRVVLHWKDSYAEGKPKPLVDFYDITKFDEGQFVSSYYASTLMERPTDGGPWWSPGGLDLYGGIDVWKVADNAMDQVRAFIRRELESKRKLKLTPDKYLGYNYESLDVDSPDATLGSFLNSFRGQIRIDFRAINPNQSNVITTVNDAAALWVALTPYQQADAFRHAMLYKRKREQTSMMPLNTYRFPLNIKSPAVFSALRTNGIAATTLVQASQLEAPIYLYVDVSKFEDSFPYVNESEDVDDVTAYIHPEDDSKQPKYERLEGELRRMLTPFYSSVSVHREPFMALKGAYHWTLQCQRDESLRLPRLTGMQNGRYGFIDWRKQLVDYVEQWLEDKGFVQMGSVKIIGVLRKNPTIEFNTFKSALAMGESLDDPDSVISQVVAQTDWDKDVCEALWKWHPTGVRYDAIDISGKGGLVTATLYFPYDKDDFARRFKAFVIQWLEENGVMKVTSSKLWVGEAADKTYPRWYVNLSVNLKNFPDDKPEYT
jgi:hypothetical protein